MGRKACCSKEGLNRGSWTAMEDGILVSYIQKHGEGKWGSLPRRAGLKRCGKSCRLRWLNYLRPGIKRGNISGDEEELIIRLHRLLGNRWSLIAGRLPGRTDNEIKNYWNTTLCKKVLIRKSGGGGGSRGDNEAASASSTRRPFSQAISDDAGPEASPEPEASPAVRTKALRCTATGLPAAAPHGCASRTAAAGDEAAVVEEETRKDHPPPGDDLLSSMDLDFDMGGELLLGSSWRGGEVDMEALMLGSGGYNDLDEFAWF